MKEGLQWMVAALVLYCAKEIKADPVKVNVYIDSFCPACRRYIVTQVAPVYFELTGFIIVHISAYGFTKDWPLSGGGYEFVCRHGSDECDGNQVLACADQHISNRDIHMDFIECFMKQDFSEFTPFDDGQKCADQVGVDWTTIEACGQAVEGQNLHHEAGVEFNALVPQPWCVPHITIDGVQSDDAYYDLKQVVCDAYQGMKPPTC